MIISYSEDKSLTAQESFSINDDLLDENRSLTDISAVYMLTEYDKNTVIANIKQILADKAKYGNPRLIDISTRFSTEYKETSLNTFKLIFHLGTAKIDLFTGKIFVPVEQIVDNKDIVRLIERGTENTDYPVEVVYSKSDFWDLYDFTDEIALNEDYLVSVIGRFAVTDLLSSKELSEILLAEYDEEAMNNRKN